MMRARKIDRNQPSLVKQLRQIGMSVTVTSGLGKGFPDLVCGYQRRNYLFEVKDPSQPPSKKKLTEDEQVFHDHWRGSVYVIESVFDVQRLLEKEKKIAEQTAGQPVNLISDG